MLTRRTTFRVILVLGLVILTGVIIQWIRAPRVCQRNFNRIALGMSREEVMTILGKPGRWFSQDDPPNGFDRFHQTWWGPECWEGLGEPGNESLSWEDHGGRIVVCFGAEDQVVRKSYLANYRVMCIGTWAIPGTGYYDIAPERAQEFQRLGITLIWPR
jgi:hypothetical protein